MRAKIDFTDLPPGLPANAVVIKDIGHREGYPSITNDAESVVQTVLRVVAGLGEAIAPGVPPIYYYDSDGVMSRLEHDGTVFTGFGLNVEEASPHG